jgi:NADPH:quinone reductase-like Zn-dependent oxidoreductase
MTTHQAVATTAKGVVDAIQVKTPEPGPGQVLIKNQYASMMPFDAVVVDLGFSVQNYPQILGFNAAGTVEKTGTGIEGLKIGDQVCIARKCFFWMPSNLISLPGHSDILRHQDDAGVRACGSQRMLKSRLIKSFHIMEPRLILPWMSQVPSNLSLDSAATIPDNIVTGFYIVFDQLKLQIPNEFPAAQPPPNADIPILIYGSGSTSGQYTIQVLKLAGYTKVIAVASPKHNDLLRSYGAAHVVDYNSSKLVEDIIAAAGGKVSIAVDCISAQATLDTVSKVLGPEGTVAVLLPVKQGNALNGPPLGTIPGDANPFPKSAKILYVSAFTYQAVSALPRMPLSLKASQFDFLPARTTICARTCSRKFCPLSWPTAPSNRTK